MRIYVRGDKKNTDDYVFEDFVSALRCSFPRIISLTRKICRTFPHLCIFQEGGPYYDMLHSLLGAYATYRPDVGYVQGMSFLAAFLLLNMDVADAFISFANLLNRPCQVCEETTFVTPFI